MKSFTFRLERVLRLRESQLKTEELKLERLLNRRREIETELNNLQTAVHEAYASIESRPFLHSAELAALDRFNDRNIRERKDCVAKLAAHDQTVAVQRAAVLAVRSKVHLLEKLRDRRKEEWQAETDRELEELVSDFSTAQWLQLQ